MGCSNSRDSSLEGIDQEALTEFENELGLKNISAETIVNVFHSYSKAGLITKNQLNAACIDSKVNLNLNQNFLDRFSDEGRILVKKIICLGILLGKGEAIEKVCLLFETYASSRESNLLSQSQLEEMITDLIEISCLTIPNYVLSLNKHDPELRRYVSKIAIITPSMINYHTYMFTETFDRITLEQFKDKIANDKLLHLLSTKFIRTFAIQMFMNMVKPAENAMKKNKDKKRTKKSATSYEKLPSVKPKLGKSNSMI
ncbi:hypothetical protein SteCoe_35441 [Stentor coeruleus]|uniref:EF-hand domain-containing protein n=1 Tax=Stentor coeruleus TaxID=5963 RepID=A0A1R2AS97_9CILI|nr:hypothetical protein SteCoe_35441 [Stentor coeruleus]